MSLMAGIDGPLAGTKEGNWVIHPDGSATVLPYALFGAAGDDAEIMVAAKNRLLYLYPTLTGAKIRLGPWAYTTFTPMLFPDVFPVRVKGAGPQVTTVYAYGSGDAFRMYNNYKPTGGSSTVKVWGGGAEDFTLNMQNAPAGANGFHIGDLKYAVFRRIDVQYATGTPYDGIHPVTTGIGVWIDNTKFYTEDCLFEFHLLQCTTGVVIDVSSSTFNAHDNCEYLISMGGAPNGNGVILQNNPNLYHTKRMRIYGGIQSSPTLPVFQNYFLAATNIGGNAFFNTSDLTMLVESDGGQEFTPALIEIQGGSEIEGHGILSYATGSGTASTISGSGTFKFSGPILGDTSLSGYSPSLVAAGVQGTLHAPQQLLAVQGATSILINGVNVGATSGVFQLYPGNTYQVNGTPSVYEFIPNSAT